MAKYHVGTNGVPKCGARGSGNRWNVVCLPVKEFNALAAESRCEKCAQKLERTTSRRAA